MTEREQFEAWMRDTHGPGVNLVRSDDGYISTVPHRIVRMTYASVEMLWEAWQAARAQGSTPNPVEVGTTVQAGQVLSDSALLAMWTGEVLSYAHTIVQAVLAKRVPMKTQRVTYTCPACHFSLEREE